MHFLLYKLESSYSLSKMEATKFCPSGTMVARSGGLPAVSAYFNYYRPNRISANRIQYANK